MEAPLLRSQRISDPHKQKDTTIVAIALLRVIISSPQSEILSKEKFGKFESVIENRSLKIVALLTYDTIIDYYLIIFKDCKVPVIFVVDRHNEYICSLEAFFLQKPLYLSLAFRNYIRSKVRIQYFELLILGKCFFQHLQINVNYVVVQPLSIIQTTKCPKSQFLHAFEIY